MERKLEAKRSGWSPPHFLLKQPLGTFIRGGENFAEYRYRCRGGKSKNLGKKGRKKGQPEEKRGGGAELVLAKTGYT